MSAQDGARRVRPRGDVQRGGTSVEISVMREGDGHEYKREIDGAVNRPAHLAAISRDDF